MEPDARLAHRPPRPQLVPRILHPIGLTNAPGINPARLIGMLLTWLPLAAASILILLQ